ncbi:P-loop containing nucleoside triphosphate hydrolase protein [Xylariomycetidae sp. FL2044]|nr:P-loop containing nucleoside triphosphate hydrolase protein [Xylariomycetidae sp. FL2044]
MEGNTDPSNTQDFQLEDDPVATQVQFLNNVIDNLVKDSEERRKQYQQLEQSVNSNFKSFTHVLQHVLRLVDSLVDREMNGKKTSASSSPTKQDTTDDAASTAATTIVPADANSQKKIDDLEHKLAKALSVSSLDSENMEKIQDLEQKLAQSLSEYDVLQANYDNAQKQLSSIDEKWAVEFNRAEAAHQELEEVWKNANDDLKREQQEAMERTRKMFEQLQAIKGNVRVMCRVRPAHPDTEAEELVNFGPEQPGENSWGNHWGKMDVEVERVNVRGETVRETRSFEYERIFGVDATNADVFAEIGDLARCALDGQKATVFAYGQTGSGKTYTMGHRSASGDASQNGVLPQTLDMIFNAAASAVGVYEYKVTISAVEIYLNNMFDLLAEDDGSGNGGKTAIRLGQEAQLPLVSPEQASEVIDLAVSTRITSSTSKNAESSRSHMIVTLNIDRETLAPGPKRGQVDTGILSLVDLAGSERVGDMEGQQRQEGIEINKSLSSLNLAITALGQGRQPSYDSTLTKVLRPSLTEGSKTLMLVMVSPLKVDAKITLASLEKGSEASKAKLSSGGSRPAAAAGAAGASASATGVRKPRLSGPPAPATGASRIATPARNTGTTGATRGGASPSSATPNRRPSVPPRTPISSRFGTPSTGPSQQTRRPPPPPKK